MDNHSGENEVSLGIVVPLYKPDIDLAVSYLAELEDKIRPEKLVVSVDSPSEKLISELPDGIIIESSKTRRGKGKAVQDGFSRLETDYVMFLDGDGSVPVESVRSIIEEEGHPLVIGNRRHKGSLNVSHSSRLKKWMGDVLVFLARKVIGTDIQDFQCGAKLFSRDSWEEVKDSVESKDFEWDLEVIHEYEKRGMSIKEVPVSWQDKPNSKVSITRDVPDFLKLLARISVEKTRLKIYSLPV